MANYDADILRALQELTRTLKASAGAGTQVHAERNVYNRTAKAKAETDYSGRANAVTLDAAIANASKHISGAATGMSAFVKQLSAGTKSALDSVDAAATQEVDFRRRSSQAIKNGSTALSETFDQLSRTASNNALAMSAYTESMSKSITSGNTAIGKFFANVSGLNSIEIIERSKDVEAGLAKLAATLLSNDNPEAARTEFQSTMQAFSAAGVTVEQLADVAGISKDSFKALIEEVELGAHDLSQLPKTIHELDEQYAKMTQSGSVLADSFSKARTQVVDLDQQIQAAEESLTKHLRGQLGMGTASIKQKQEELASLRAAQEAAQELAETLEQDNRQVQESIRLNRDARGRLGKLNDELPKMTKAIADVSASVTNELAAGATRASKSLDLMTKLMAKFNASAGIAAMGSGLRALAQEYKDNFKSGVNVAGTEAAQLGMGVGEAGKLYAMNKQVAMAGDGLDALRTQTLSNARAQMTYFGSLSESAEGMASLIAAMSSASAVTGSMADRSAAATRMFDEFFKGVDKGTNKLGYGFSQLGVSADEYVKMQQSIVANDNIANQLAMASGETERRAILESVNQRMLEYKAMGMTTEQAQKAATALGNVVGKSPKEYMKQMARNMAVMSAMGVDQNKIQTYYRYQMDPNSRNADTQRLAGEALTDASNKLMQMQGGSVAGQLVGMNLQHTLGFDAETFRTAGKEGMKVDDAAAKQQRLAEANFREQSKVTEHAIKTYDMISTWMKSGAGQLTLGSTILGASAIMQMAANRMLIQKLGQMSIGGDGMDLPDLSGGDPKKPKGGKPKGGAPKTKWRPKFGGAKGGIAGGLLGLALAAPDAYAAYEYSSSLDTAVSRGEVSPAEAKAGKGQAYGALAGGLVGGTAGWMAGGALTAAAVGALGLGTVATGGLLPLGLILAGSLAGGAALGKFGSDVGGSAGEALMTPSGKTVTTDIKREDQDTQREFMSVVQKETVNVSRKADLQFLQMQKVVETLGEVRDLGMKQVDLALMTDKERQDESSASYVRSLRGKMRAAKMFNAVT